MRIVLFRPGALGDALLALPTLALLRAREPRPHVTLVARADVLPLARAAGLVDDAHDYDLPCWSALWSESPRLRPPASPVLAGADAAVAWCTDDGTLARNLRACGIPCVIVAPGQATPEGLASPPARHLTHTALYLARALGPLLPAPPPATPRDLPPIAADLARAEDADAAEATLARVGAPPERVVALHPGSGRAAKCWPAASYAAIARRLLTADYAPLLLAGPADDEALTTTLAALGADASRAAVARDLPLPALLGVLRRCGAYVGNDSGVTHLAALAGVPTLALFGPTDPFTWGPLGPHARVLWASHPPGPADSGHARPMTSLTVARVWDALHAQLNRAAR